jgi:hypothetical protein
MSGLDLERLVLSGGPLGWVRFIKRLDHLLNIVFPKVWRKPLSTMQSNTSTNASSLGNLWGHSN